jgi:hypothetical protein
MARYISSKIANKLPATTPDDKGTVLVDKTTVALDVNLAANDIIIFSKIPSGCEPVDLTAICDQLDSNVAPTLTLTFGILNDAGTDLVASTDFITDTATLGRTAAQSMNRAANPLGLMLSAVDAVNTASDIGTKETGTVATSLLGRRHGDRILAAKVTNVAATKKAGNITAFFSYTAK